MRRPELLIPASSLEVLKTAVIYGADAVYIGGEAFGLRAKAKNFSMEEMKEGIEFAQKDVSVSDLKTNVKKHYEIPWIKGSSRALKSVCIGHNCELSEADVRKLLEENKIGTDVQIKQSECTYRIR